MRLQRGVVVGLGALVLAGCGPREPVADGSGPSSASSTTRGSASGSGSASSTSTPADSGSGPGTTAVTGSADTITGSDGATTATTTGDRFEPIDCGGLLFNCGDGMDNDGDGLVDLADPECITPCDDDEGWLAAGIPDQWKPGICGTDCYFDGNTGQGDDGCYWPITCDPANPGQALGCDFTDDPTCADFPNADAECVAFCEPRVFPGCDCFGCCEVEGPAGPVNVFLASPCSLDDLDSCWPCTPQWDVCGLPCDPGGCQICFGQTEPPAGCGGVPECPSGDPCSAESDCVDGFCQLGCCWPDPSG